MATATSHEATKSNCVATDCALGGAKQRGQRGRPSACSDQWHGGRVGWRRGQGGAGAACHGTAAAVTWTVVRAAGKTYKTKTSEMKQH